MLIFIVQNETHASNFYAIIDKFLETEHTNFHVIHLDKTTHLNTLPPNPPSWSKLLNIESEAPFYHMPRRQRVRWLLRNRKIIAESVRDANLLVIGNDGAIQKMMAERVRANGGRVIMILDGLTLPWPKTLRARLGQNFHLLLNHVVKITGGSFLVPGLLGHSNLDQIFVMDKVVELELRRQGIKTPITTIMLPRFREFVDRFNEKRECRKLAGEPNFLYATSAYAWHALQADARRQAADVQDFLDVAECRHDAQFKIRIHPRDNVHAYESLRLPKNVQLSDIRTPLADDLAWSDLLLTARSSAAYESGLVGIPCGISTARFPVPPKNSYWAMAQHIHLAPKMADIINKYPYPIHKCNINISNDIFNIIRNFQ